MDEKPNEKQKIQNEVLVMAKTIGLVPSNVLTIALIKAMDKIMYDGEASTPEEHHRILSGCMELIRQTFANIERVKKKEAEQEKNEERSKEFADALLARVQKAAKEGTPPPIVMPGNGDIN